MMRKIVFSLFLFLLQGAACAAPEKLFIDIGPANVNELPAHTAKAQSVRVNRRALKSPRVQIDLFGETVYAVRTRVERHKRGEIIWTGHLDGQATNSVIITIKGAAFSGMIQKGEQIFRISGGPGKSNRLLEVDLQSLPLEDLEGMPDGYGEVPPELAEASADLAAAGDTIQQDLLVAYTQAACDYSGGCAQLEADISTAVADLNLAYSESGINITMNLVGTHLTDYTEPSSSSTALNELRLTDDGVMDDVHVKRDELGADIVALVYDGPGCGRGYVGSSPTSAFSVTDVPCLVGNRTMAHEIGHNQGAEHDRVTSGGGNIDEYQYGYRRCNDGSIDDFGSPYFRSVLSYSCTNAPRVGRFSNPNINYVGVPQGVDPAIDNTKGAWNARTINESALYVAGFRDRSTPEPLPPQAPTGLSITAVSFDRMDLSWTDNANNETAIILEQSSNGSPYTVIASLSADTTSYTADGLMAESAYSFRVKARNSVGDSAYSNTVSANTTAAPSVIDAFAQSENANEGTVTGVYTDTHADDGNAQIITEVGTGGPKRRRQQSYSHTWVFNVPAGAGGVMLSANSWISGSEAAVFEYSTDLGVSWQPLFIVNDTSSTAVQQVLLPPTTQGSVWVRAVDGEQINGEAVDSLSVDYLVISSSTQVDPVPAAPTNLVVTDVQPGSIGMSFQDQADNELGFEVRRSTADPGLDCSTGEVIATLNANVGTGPVTFSDTTVASSTDYWYTVTAFNSGGNSVSCTNAVSVQSAISVEIILTASGYKEKGLQKAALSWSGGSSSSSQVIVLRDGTTIATTANDGEYIDEINRKGGGSYRYQICEQQAPSMCSNELTLNF